jgi:hypothetical protein
MRPVERERNFGVDLSEYLAYLRIGLSWLYPLLLFTAALVCWRHRPLSSRMPLLLAGFTIVSLAAGAQLLACYGPAAEPPLRGLALRNVQIILFALGCVGWSLIVLGLAAVFANFKERLSEASSLQPIKDRPRLPQPSTLKREQNNDVQA